MFTTHLASITAAVIIAASSPLTFAVDALGAGGTPGTPAEHDHDHGTDAGDKSGGPSAEVPKGRSPMERMHELHEKMMSANTPEERQAAKAEHDEAKKEMMARMKDMKGKKGMKGMAGEGATSLDGRMQALEQRVDLMDLALRVQMLEGRVDRMTKHPHDMGGPGGMSGMNADR